MNARCHQESAVVFQSFTGWMRWTFEWFRYLKPAPALMINTLVIQRTDRKLDGVKGRDYSKLERRAVDRVKYKKCVIVFR